MEKEKKVKVKSVKLEPVFNTFEAALKTWWQNIKKIVLVYLWGLVYALIPMAVVAVLLGVGFWLGDRAGMGFRVSAVIIAATGFIISLYFLIRSYMGIFLLVKHDYKGLEKKIYAETKEMFWPYIGLVLLTTVFIILWTMLLIIPGIIYSVFYSFACYALFFEDKRGMAAIRRSSQLVTGYFWPVFGRFMFIGLVIWIFSMLISIPGSFTADSSFASSLWGGLVQVLNFLVGPMVLIYTYSIYTQLVKIKK